MKTEETSGSMHRVILEKKLLHSLEAVWQALTDPAALAKWLLPNSFKPQLGHRFHFIHRTAEGKRQKVNCQVVEIEAPCRLTYTWRAEDEEAPTLVTWTLEPVEEGTCLRLEHIGPVTSCVFNGSADFLVTRLHLFLQPDVINTHKQTLGESSLSQLPASPRSKPIGRILLKPPSRTLRCIGRSGRVLNHCFLKYKEVSPCIR